MKKKGVHDMGGDAAGPVDRHEHTPTLTERRIDAVMQLLRQRPRVLWKTDENRRTLESLAPEVYDGHGYYARWTLGMRSLLIEKGVLSAAEIDARLAEVKARFGKAAAGDRAPTGKATAGRKAAGKPGAKGKSAAKKAAKKQVAATKAAAVKAKAASMKVATKDASKQSTGKAAPARRTAKAATKSRAR